MNANSGSDSERESDFNPFDDESDSNGPWAYRKKNKKEKGKKRKLASNHTSSKKNKVPPKPLPPLDAVEKASAMKADLLDKIERLGDTLPPNTLDQLIDDLGGPENVAEMTGRKGRVVSNDGNIQYESRSEADAPLETLNMVEKQRFMDGEKHIAIISEAASSGISLQSDRRVKNQKRRVHMTLELPWSADKAIQQFGRTHRSNQVNAPEYLFLISDLAGERRFASIVAKRLESLGALTHGDRRATESRDLSQFNIDTKYGRTALETAMRAVMEYETPLVQPPKDYKGNFFYDVRRALIGVSMITEDPTGYLILEKDYNNMSKFMNRILGLPVELQNGLFQYFTDTLDAVIAQAKKVGRYDLGILDLGTGGDLVKRVKLNSFLQKHATGTAKTELHTVLVERGISWEEALEKLEECTEKDEGFYLSSQARNNRKTAILAVADTGGSKSKGGKGKLFRVYRPNTGLQAKQETLEELKSKYQKSTKKNVEEHWKENFEQSATLCSHMYWYNQCRRKTMGVLCEVGLRQRQYYVLSGSVLAVWTKIENIMTQHHGSNNAKLQVVRLKIDEDSKIVGCIIPGNVVEVLKEELAIDAADVKEEVFDS
ncbi:hypothetical protein JTE90_003847 [Oedothorax gibbosus]|nr:hypothetical protein JTE90_003847 [Oedothorax gibbosus]